MDQDRDGEFGESEDDVFTFSILADEQERIFWEGFEAPDPGWKIDNGVWEIGEPTSGPGGAYNGLNCAATVLGGDYPANDDSRLISPEIVLPDTAEGEEVLLRFWQHFTYSSGDKGEIQIQTYDDATGEWSDWTTLKTMRQYAPVWHHARVDLTQYAGQRIRIAFYHEDNKDTTFDYYESAGWYIDDFEILKQTIPTFSGVDNFESGWDGWYSDNGIWQIGEPTSGPGGAYSSLNCAATILDGNYPRNPDSRLISPEIVLPGVGGNEVLLLRFWQWHSYASGDYGKVEISKWKSDVWGDWVTLMGPAVGSSDGWSLAYLDLTQYAGQRVRISFYHEDNKDTTFNYYEDSGWYIDEVQLSHFIPTKLTLGEDLNGTFNDDGDRQYYVIHVPPGGHLRLLLDDLDDSGINEIYLRHGALPSAGEYDYRYSNLGGADQEIFIPNATPGYWYILVYTDSMEGDGEYTIHTEFSTDIMIEEIMPDSVGNTAPATITIDGAGFDLTTEVALAQGETTVPADEVSYVSSSHLLAEIDLTCIAPGSYQLRVQSGEDSDEMPFEVLDGGAANFETNLIVPSRVGYHNVATIWVEYANTGEVAMKAPLLVVTAEQRDRKGAILKLSSIMPIRGFWTSTMPQGFSNTIQLLASGDTPGILQPGESRRVPIQFAGWQQPWDMSYPPITFKMGVLYADDDTAVDWDSFKDEMQPESITEEVWEPLWANFVSQAGSTWGDYVSMLTNNAIYLGKLGQHVTDIGDLLAFEFAQADALNVVRYLAASTDAYAPAPGIDLSFRRVFPQSISSRFELGALGRGWSHNWNVSLEVAEDGTVTIQEPNGTRRIFQPDSRPGGRYFPMEGDHATLTNLGGGAFSLQEPDGLLRVFRTDGKLDYIEDTNGNRITTGYTGDLLTSLTHSVGQALQITHNAAGRIETITDPNSRKTTFTYDAKNEHLISAEYFDGSTVSYEYSTGAGTTREHALTEIAFPGGSHQYFTYDGRGRLDTLSRDGGAEAVSFSYDSAGMVAASDTFGNIAKYYVDHRGVLSKAGDPQGDAIRLTYDDEFNLSSITDPAGHSYVYDYDDEGNLIHATDSLGNGTRFAYAGPFNRLTKLIDANGNVTDYGYDDNGDLTSITYDDDTVESWAYDDEGNPTSWTNRRGNGISYEYNSDGRLSAKIYPDSSRVEYNYDTLGNLISATDATGTTTLEYDANNRLEKITYPGERFLQYTYNAAGQRASSLNQLGHHLDYHYDAMGRLERITDESSAEIVHYHYDAAGRLERKVLGNGVYTKYEYDEAWQLTSLINYKPDNTILSQFIYTYDTRGRRTSMTTLEGTWDYEYDDTGQLTAWSAPDGKHVQYQYDALGNRITVTDNDTVTDYTTNNMNQYSQVGDTTYEFDNDGNLMQKISPSDTTTYTYNYENRLVALSSPEGNWTYTYDAFGNHVRVDDDGSTTDFVIDPVGFRDIVGEYDHSNSDLIARYDHGFGLLSRTEAVGDPAYYTFDAIGSTSELTSNSATALNSYAYLPFGELLSGVEGVENRFAYVGEYGVTAEKNGRHCMRARDYDAVVGRFISTDPIGLRGNERNSYGYSFNNPIKNLSITAARTVRKRSGAYTVYFNGQNFKNLDQQMMEKDRFWTEGDYHNLPEYKYHYDTLDRPFKDPKGFLPEFEIDWKHGKVKIKPKSYWDLIWWMFKEVMPVPPDYCLDDVLESLAKAVRPCDPNEKTGPSGYSEQQLIAGDIMLSYRISFENWEQATSPAQIVTITDQLDEDLEWSTFELTETGFGDVRIAVPANTQHFETTKSMSYNGVDFEVQIEVGIHLATGEVYANFYSIEPLSGLPPSVDIGFLPPEDGTGRGQGYFTYVIKAKEGLSAGTEVRNVALITFDFQETIATNQVDPHDPAQGTDPNKECLNTIAPDEVNLITTSTEGGSVTHPGEGAYIFDWGEVVNLKAIPNEGYMFLKWTGDVDTIDDVYAEETTVTMYGNFSITANFSTGMPVHLKKGFNLIAIPADVTKQPDLKDWLAVLGDSTEIEKVLVYDVQAGEFITLVPDDAANPSFMLQGGEGLIVYAKQDKEITFTSVLCSSIDLMPGFNLVGFACPGDSYTPFQLLTDLGSKTVSSIQRYSTEKGAFETASFDLEGQLVGVDFPIIPGEGYFVYMKQEILGF